MLPPRRIFGNTFRYLLQTADARVEPFFCGLANKFRLSLGNFANEIKMVSAMIAAVADTVGTVEYFMLL